MSRPPCHIVAAVLLALLAAPPAVARAQTAPAEIGTQEAEPTTTRQEILQRQRESKRGALTPYVVSDAEDRVSRLETFRLPRRIFSIRAGVVAFLARPSHAQNLDVARTVLDAMVGEVGAARRRTRLEAARLVGVLPEHFGPQLSRLLGDEDPGVVRAALRAVGRLGTLQSVDLILNRLGDTRFTSHASAVLVGWGDRVVDTLRSRLEASQTPPGLRRQIPGALLQIGSAAAQRALFAGLMSPDPALRHEVVVSLNRLRVQHPDVAIDTQAVEMVLAAEVVGHYRSYQVLVTLDGGADSDDAAMHGPRRAMDVERERIFRLLALLLPKHDMHSAHDGLLSADPAVRANAVEFLDNVLEPQQLRHQLLPLFDDQVTTAQRAALAGSVVGATMNTPQEAISTLLASEDSWMRSCGLFAIGTLQLRELEPELDRALAGADPREREAALRAKTHLPPADEPVLQTVDADRWMGGTTGVG